MQHQLWHDTIFDALGSAVQVSGGVKKVSAKLWPALTTDAATIRLRSCLNPDHPQKLCPEELLLVLRLAKEAGDNSVMTFLARSLGYEIIPLTPVETEKRAKRAKKLELLEQLKRLEDDE
jgi:hypothetical protein